MTWLSGWTRRKIKIVENLTVSDYQMKLIVHKSGLGPDTSTDIYLGGNCRDDFADLRFTDPNQTTHLNYWIESITGTTPNFVATVWIKIPTLTPTNNIYIYYDNPIASSPVSSGTNTFDFFDDYDDNNIADWTAISCGFSPSSGATGGKAYISESGNGGCIHLRKSFSVTTGVWETSLRLSAVNGGNNFDLGGFTIMWDGVTSTFYPNNGYVVYLTGQSGNDRLIFAKYSSGTGVALINVAWAADTVEHKIKVTRDSSNRFEIFLDGVSKGSVIDSTYTSLSYIGLWGLGGGGGWPKTFYWDNTSISKYTSPEPTFGVSGTEELNITATLMTLDTNTCTGPCQIIAGVTWQNMGSSNVTFTPAVLINGTTIAYATSSITIGPSPATGSSTITTLTLLVGTHTICPYPN